MAPEQPDYYALLGVARGASRAEVDRAYRRAARATHPDIHPQDESASERFRAVTIAYETLGDPECRASYDRTHPSTEPTSIRIVVRRRPSPDPVHLGRGPLEPTPERPFPASAGIHPATELVDLVEALTRLVAGWPFR
jgi:curved DNA-binding protein CbpA